MTTTPVTMTEEQKTLARAAIQQLNPGPAWILPMTGGHRSLVLDRTEVVNGVEIQRETDEDVAREVREVLRPIVGELGMLTIKDLLSPNVQDKLDDVGARF